MRSSIARTRHAVTFPLLARRSGQCHIYLSLRPPYVLYLDQADISYLALGRGPGKSDYRPIRERLLRLSDARLVRVRLSLAHILECQGMSLRTLASLISFLRELPRGSFVRNYPHEIWDAELKGGVPHLRENLIAGTPFIMWAVHVLFTAPQRRFNQLDAYLLRSIKRGWQDRDYHRQLANELDPLLEALTRDPCLIYLPPGAARLRNLPSLTYQLLALEAWRWFARAMKKKGYASWTTLMSALKNGYLHFDDDIQRIPAQSNWWHSPLAATMPATSLRVAINRSLTADLARSTFANDKADLYHSAFAPYSDGVTVDKRILDAVKRTRQHLARPRWWFPTGNVSALLDEAEDAAQHR